MFLPRPQEPPKAVSRSSAASPTATPSSCPRTFQDKPPDTSTATAMLGGGVTWSLTTACLRAPATDKPCRSDGSENSRICTVISSVASVYRRAETLAARLTLLFIVEAVQVCRIVDQQFFLNIPVGHISVSSRRGFRRLACAPRDWVWPVSAPKRAFGIGLYHRLCKRHNVVIRSTRLGQTLGARDLYPDVFVPHEIRSSLKGSELRPSTILTRTM